MFCRSVNYSINGYHRQHIVVLAEVVSVALELSSDEVVLRPSPGLLADSGKKHPVLGGRHDTHVDQLKLYTFFFILIFLGHLAAGESKWPSGYNDIFYKHF